MENWLESPTPVHRHPREAGGPRWGAFLYPRDQDHGPCLHQPQKVRVAVVPCMEPTPKGLSAPGTAGSVLLAPTCPHITLLLRTRQETALTTLVTNVPETVETGGPVHLSPAGVIHFRTLGIDDCVPKSSLSWCSGTAVPCALGVPIECYLHSVTKTAHATSGHPHLTSFRLKRRVSASLRLHDG